MLFADPPLAQALLACVFVFDFEVVVGDIVVEPGFVARSACTPQALVHVPDERIGVGVEVIEGAVDVIKRESAFPWKAAAPLPGGLFG